MVSFASTKDDPVYCKMNGAKAEGWKCDDPKENFCKFVAIKSALKTVMGECVQYDGKEKCKELAKAPSAGGPMGDVAKSMASYECYCKANKKKDNPCTCDTAKCDACGKLVSLWLVFMAMMQ